MEVPQIGSSEESEPVDEADRSLTISDQAEQLLEAFSEFGIDGEMSRHRRWAHHHALRRQVGRGTKDRTRSAV